MIMPIFSQRKRRTLLVEIDVALSLPEAWNRASFPYSTGWM
jgi:hypothetical protein